MPEDDPARAAAPLLAVAALALLGLAEELDADVEGEARGILGAVLERDREP